MSFEQRDRYRIVLMGAPGVGKSAIISRFMYQKFCTEYKATVEEFHQDDFVINGLDVTLDFVDTAGSFDFPAMRKLSISTGDAFVLVYSVEDEDSFNEVNRLRELILEQKGFRSLTPIVIVGNKIDLPAERRAIQKEMADITANLVWDCGFVEVSAKDDVNIPAVFNELLVKARMQLGLEPATVELKRKRWLSETNVNARTSHKKRSLRKLKKFKSKPNNCVIA